MDVVRIDQKKCNPSENLAHNRLKWRNIIYVLGKGFDDDADRTVQHSGFKPNCHKRYQKSRTLENVRFFLFISIDKYI